MLRSVIGATSNSLGLRANMTSSIKPEIHNISLRRQSRTEPRPRLIYTKIFGEDRVCNSRYMLITETDRHTDMLITILRHPYRGAVKRQ